MIDQTGELAEPGATTDPQQASTPQADSRQDHSPRSQPAATNTIARLRTPALILIPAALLFFLYLRVADTAAINSDGANNALQAWDMLHGHLLLPGWVIGDATYYTFELPIFALNEAVFGLGSEAIHVSDALVYLLVAVMAALIACRASRGRTTAVRCCIIAAMLGVPITVDTIMVMLSSPDHIGTCAVLLAAVYLADLATKNTTGKRRYLPIWLGVVLTLGQVGDQTVLYVGVVSIGLIGLYRMVRARGWRNVEGAIVLAAALSYPAARLLRDLTRALGGYTMVPPLTKIAPADHWWANFHYTWQNLGVLYGIVPGQAVNNPMTGVTTALGWLSAAAALAGFVRVLVRWGTVGRGAQILCAAIVVNLGSYTVSALPNAGNAREIVFVLPAGCVLAALAWTGAAVERRRVALPAAIAIAVAAVLPAAVVARQPAPVSRPIVLAAWLKAHGLTYGIGGYWDASAVSVESGNAVQVRAVWIYRGRFLGYSWEARSNWYGPAENDATFFITGGNDPARELTPAEVESVWGAPAATYLVDGRIILVYHQNLLRKVRPLAVGLG